MVRSMAVLMVDRREQ
jgi:hypothetical protein